MAGELVYSPTLQAVVCSPPALTAQLRSLIGGASFALQVLPRAEEELQARARSLFAMTNAISFSGSMVIASRLLAGVLTLVQGVAEVNPSKIASGTAAIATAVGDFTLLVNFPAALARTALTMRAELVGFLTALRNQIVALQSRYTNVNAMIAAATAAGNATWLANATCAKERLDAKVAQLNASISALALALQLLSVILCIVTGGHLEAFPTLDPNNLVTDAIDAAIAALNAIPIPELPTPELSC